MSCKVLIVNSMKNECYFTEVLTISRHTRTSPPPRIRAKHPLPGIVAQLGGSYPPNFGKSQDTQNMEESHFELFPRMEEESGFCTYYREIKE
jgi:hypothetical protein